MTSVRKICLVLGVFAAATGVAFAGPTDFVFIIDTTASMSNEIAAVRNGLSDFVDGLDSSGIDARFATIVYGGAPELILDFTSDKSAVVSAFSTVNIGGSTTSSYNHNVNPEAGLEAIRIALGTATDSTLLRTATVGGSGGLSYRSDARKNLILVTDEDSDRPFYEANRLTGQTSIDPPSPLNSTWQQEVDNTAADVLAEEAYLNLLISINGASEYQYGYAAYDVSDADLLNYDRAATLQNYVDGGLYDQSLTAQVLAGGLLARSFNILQVDDTNWIDNFYAAKIEEATNDPGTSTVPAPGAVLLSGFGAALVGMIRRRQRA